MIKFIAGLALGAFVAILGMSHNPLSKAQLEMYTFHTLQDDMSLDNDTKWLVFLLKRAEWGMCEETEKRIVTDNGKFSCVRTPVEFQPIYKE